MGTESVAQSSRTAHRLVLGLLLLVVAGLYARTLGHDYTYDDRHYVMAQTDAGTPNVMVTEWQGFGAYLTTFYGSGVV
ncbi:MAG: hypothetical protein V3V08_22890, partial [Nannocystaceae bacterium]